VTRTARVCVCVCVCVWQSRVVVVLKAQNPHETFYGRLGSFCNVRKKNDRTALNATHTFMVNNGRDIVAVGCDWSTPVGMPPLAIAAQETFHKTYKNATKMRQLYLNGSRKLLFGPQLVYCTVCISKIYEETVWVQKDFAKVNISVSIRIQMIENIHKSIARTALPNKGSAINPQGVHSKKI